ncbi:MAG: peptidylprolyl isomerase [Elusimicrobiota bacterium]
MNFFNKNKMVFLIFGLFFLSPNGNFISAEVVGKSIATINGEAIFLNEFESNWLALQEQQKQAPDQKLSPDWEKNTKEMLLNQMVEEKVLLQEAKKKNILVPKRQLEEGILQIKNRFKILKPGVKPTKEDYERDLTSSEYKDFIKELTDQNISEKEFFQKIEDQLKVLRLTEDAVKGRVASPFKDGQPANAGDPEARELSVDYENKVKSLYSQIEKKFNQPDFKPNPENEIDQMTELLKSRLSESVRARHILVKSSRKDDVKKRSEALNKAKAIKKELEKGADFIELAKQKSDGPSAKTGGDLGYFSKGQMVPEFDKVAFILPVGSISDPIETEFGYHIMKVEEKRAAQKLKHDDIKLDLAAYLFQDEMKKNYEKYVDELKKKADIKIILDVTKK